MNRIVKDFLKEKTENLSFIELKKGSGIDINGYKLTESVPLPIVIDELVSEIKGGRAQEELNMKSIVEGMIYTSGVDPDFKYFQTYREILYSYNKDIEDFILYRGLKFAEDGQLEEALVNFSALANINPENVNGLFNFALALEEKARTFFKNKDINNGNIFLFESTRYFEEVLNVDPSFSMAYYKLGFHYRQQKQFRKSKITWERFLDYSDNQETLDEVKQQLLAISDDVIYEEGYTEVLRGNPEGGLAKLLSLEEKYSDWWNLLFMIGVAYRQIGQYVKAKRQFEKVLAIYPEQPDSLNEMGLCLAVLQNPAEAVKKFSQALKIKPNDYEILCNRGMTYLQMGDLAEATKDIERAYKINSEDEITISCKNHLDRMK